MIHSLVASVQPLIILLCRAQGSEPSSRWFHGGELQAASPVRCFRSGDVGSL